MVYTIKNFWFLKTDPTKRHIILHKPEKVPWWTPVSPSAGLWRTFAAARRAGYLQPTSSASSLSPNLPNHSAAQVFPPFLPPLYIKSYWASSLKHSRSCVCPADGSVSGNVSTSSSCSETYTSYSDIKPWPTVTAALLLVLSQQILKLLIRFHHKPKLSLTFFFWLLQYLHNQQYYI